MSDEYKKEIEALEHEYHDLLNKAYAVKRKIQSAEATHRLRREHERFIAEEEARKR